VALTLGAVPIDRTIEEHDRAVALISHTPQVVASVLASQLVDAAQNDIELAGQGIRDTIRIASSNADLWSQILAGNAKEVSQRVRQVAHDLEVVASALESDKSAMVAETLIKGSAGRDRLPGKHGTGAKNSTVLTVRVEDKPGELARLFAVAAASQVNLEDVRIDHSLGRMTGLVELSVSPNSSQILIDALVAAEFVVVQ
jgi:prephenate dehydrogenase